MPPRKNLGLALLVVSANHLPALHAQTTQLAPNPGTSGGETGNSTAQITAHSTTGQAITGGVSDVLADFQEKGGYTGQLYDPTALSVTPSPSDINEAAALQLAATLTMDDDTFLPLDPNSVGWTVAAGPLTGIDAAGLATAGAVFEDTPATAQGEYLSFSGTAGLTILDVDPDNFGSYAGDAITDAWQVTYFGAPPNADAAPGENPDGDSYDNFFEFLTGYSPVDGSDFFTLRLAGVDGSGASLELSKIIPGTRYRIERSSDLGNSDPWTEFANFTTTIESSDHIVPDPGADPESEFYRVGVEAE